MPVLIGSTRPDPPPILYQPGIDVGRARATYIDPAGGVWPLDEWMTGFFTLDDVTGLGAVQVTITADPSPRGGTVPRHVYDEPRIINWPLHIYASTHMDFVALWRKIVRAFTMTKRRGLGWLQIAQPDGKVREIGVQYGGGLDSSPGKHLVHEDAVISLYCPDPYWRDATPTRVVREFAAGVPYLSPYPTVSASQVLGQTTITADSDVETWPEWTITGPGSLITATSAVYGEAFELDPDFDSGGPLGAGDTVTITTEPPTIRGPAGEVWTEAVDFPGAVLWPLYPGENAVEFEVQGSGAGTRIELLYRNRYETP